jgi:hypothetical protein
MTLVLVLGSRVQRDGVRLGLIYDIAKWTEPNICICKR